MIVLAAFLVFLALGSLLGILARSFVPVFVVAMIGIMVAVWVGIGFAGTFATHNVYQGSTPLHAIGVGDTLHGSFFLGSGQIGKRAVFYYYADNGNGQYYLSHVNASGTLIQEDASPGNARLDLYCDEINDKTFLLWTTSYNCHYVIHVPPNSVTTKMFLGLP